MNYAVAAGRIFYSLIFIMSSFSHFTKGPVGYAASHGVPLASIAVPISGVLALLGGLSVALGYKAKWGAWLLVLFLVPVTLMMHNFIADPTQKISFMKNLSMLGAALLIAHFGAGPVSVDAALANRKKG